MWEGPGEVVKLLALAVMAACFTLRLVIEFRIDHPAYGQILRQAFHQDAPVTWPWFRDTTTFYGILGWFAPLTRLIGEPLFLFLISTVISGATAYAVWYTLEGPAGWLLVSCVLVGSQTLPGADLCIVYPHHLSQTVAGQLAGLAALALTVRGRHGAAAWALAITWMFHLKSGVAFTPPLALYWIWTRPAGVLPVLAPSAVVLLNVALMTSGLSPELQLELAAREGVEADILLAITSPDWIGNVAWLPIAAWLALRAPRCFADPLRPLLIASLVSLAVGLVACACYHSGLAPVRVALVAWPKIATPAMACSLAILAREVTWRQSPFNAFAVAFVTWQPASLSSGRVLLATLIIAVGWCARRHQGPWALAIILTILGTIRPFPEFVRRLAHPQPPPPFTYPHHGGLR